MRIAHFGTMRWFGVCFYILLPLTMGACGNILDRSDAQDPSDGISQFGDRYGKDGTLAGNGGANPNPKPQGELVVLITEDLYFCRYNLNEKLDSGISNNILIQIFFSPETSSSTWHLVKEGPGPELRLSLKELPEPGRLICVASLWGEDGSLTPLAKSSGAHIGSRPGTSDHKEVSNESVD